MKIFRKTKILILPAIVLYGFLMTVLAQNAEFFKGSEQPVFKSGESSKEQCFVYDKYIVKAIMTENSKSDSGSAGEGQEIDIFRRDSANAGQKNCQVARKSFVNIKNAEGNEFSGLFGNLVFVKRNVFPDGGDLDVYDLEKNKVVFSTEYTEWDGYDTNISDDKFLNYRQWSKKDGLLKNCREAKKWKREGFGISWTQTKKLDLQTMKAISVGSLRCINMQ